MINEKEAMDKVLDLANILCQEKYDMSLYEKCGLSVKDDTVLKTILNQKEARDSLSKGSIDFLESLSKLSVMIGAILIGTDNMIASWFKPKSFFSHESDGIKNNCEVSQKEINGLLRQLYANPLLARAYEEVRLKLSNEGYDVKSATDDFIQLLEL